MGGTFHIWCGGEGRVDVLFTHRVDSHVGRSAFLGQASVYIRSNGEIRVPFIQKQTSGVRKRRLLPVTDTLKVANSIKSSGRILTSPHMLQINFSPYLRIRAFSSKNFLVILCS